MFKKKKIEKKYTWNDVTISQYRRMLALDPSDEDYSFNLVAVFENTTLEDIMSRPIDGVLKCTAALSKFITKAPTPSLIKTHYTLNGKKYCLSLNPADITTAQYFDFVNAEKKMPDCLSQILAIFMVPEGKEYNTGYDLESAQYDIENFMNVREALSIADFFSTLYRVFSKRLIKKARKALIQARKAGVPEAEVQTAMEKLDNFCRLTKFWK